MCMSGGMGSFTGQGAAKGAVGALSSIIGYNAQVDDFNASELTWENNFSNAMVAGRDQENALTTRAIQEQEATGQKVQQYSYEGAIKTAQAAASAAEGGVGGNSVDDVIRGIQSQAAYNRSTAKLNGDMTASQIADEQKGVVSQEVGRINSVQRPTAPNPAEVFLGVAGAVLGGMTP